MSSVDSLATVTEGKKMERETEREKTDVPVPPNKVKFRTDGSTVEQAYSQAFAPKTDNGALPFSKKRCSKVGAPTACGTLQPLSGI